MGKIAMKSVYTLLITVGLLFINGQRIHAMSSVTTGKAIGDNNTSIKEVTKRAKNNARQKALEKAGVFIESRTEVVNYQLTKDEVSMITGAVTRTEIIDKRVELVGTDIITVEIKTRVWIDDKSLNKALKVYRDRSRIERKFVTRIQHLEGENRAITKKVEGLEKRHRQNRELWVDHKVSEWKNIAGWDPQIQESPKRKLLNRYENDLRRVTKNDDIWGCLITQMLERGAS